LTPNLFAILVYPVILSNLLSLVIRCSLRTLRLCGEFVFFRVFPCLLLALGAFCPGSVSAVNLLFFFNLQSTIGNHQSFSLTSSSSSKGAFVFQKNFPTTRIARSGSPFQRLLSLISPDNCTSLSANSSAPPL